MRIDIFHHFDVPGHVDRTLATISTHVSAIQAQGVQIMDKLDDINEDLDKVSTDLATIKTSVGTTVEAQKVQIEALQAELADLKAGDVLEQAKIDALVEKAEAAKVLADETLAAVTPS